MGYIYGFQLQSSKKVLVCIAEDLPSLVGDLCSAVFYLVVNIPLLAASNKTGLFYD